MYEICSNTIIIFSLLLVRGGAHQTFLTLSTARYVFCVNARVTFREKCMHEVHYDMYWQMSYICKMEANWAGCVCHYVSLAAESYIRQLRKKPGYAANRDEELSSYSC